jgi:hypothetical protein
VNVTVSSVREDRQDDTREWTVRHELPATFSGHDLDWNTSPLEVHGLGCWECHPTDCDCVLDGTGATDWYCWKPDQGPAYGYRWYWYSIPPTVPFG